jgi:hypothetical protein
MFTASASGQQAQHASSSASSGGQASMQNLFSAFSSSSATAEGQDDFKNKNFVVVDCRPKNNAVGNIAKGGGWEIADHYPAVKLKFLSAFAL